MSDTQELLAVEGEPGWRYDPKTGEQFYSAGWLNDGTVGVAQPHLRVVDAVEEDA